MFKESILTLSDKESMTYRITFLPYNDVETGEPIALIHLYGDTHAHKAKLKEWSYTWKNRDRNTFLLATDYPDAWQKQVVLSQLSIEVKQLEDVGVKYESENEYAFSIYNDLEEAKFTRKTKAVLELALERYVQILLFKEQNREPEIIRPALLSHPDDRWNGKFYKDGTVIYLNDRKVTITEIEARELLKYRHEIVAWQDYHYKLNCIAGRKGGNNIVRIPISSIQKKGLIYNYFDKIQQMDTVAFHTRYVLDFLGLLRF